MHADGALELLRRYLRRMQAVAGRRLLRALVLNVLLNSLHAVNISGRRS
jgi:hypothetical protein